MRFQLKDELSASALANETDVMTMKGALRTLGEYDTPSYGLTPFPDMPMFDGLKRVQKKNGLTVDGIARPGGPTETSVRSELARKALSHPAPDSGFTAATADGTGKSGKRVRPTPPKPASRPTPQSTSLSGGGALARQQQAETSAIVKRIKARQKQAEARSHPAPTQSAPQAGPLLLSGGVGKAQPNRFPDVIALKNALSWTGHYPVEKARRGDPDLDEDLTWGLFGFQRDFGLIHDGFSRPGGETEARLNHLIQPMIALATAETETSTNDTEPPSAPNPATDRPVQVADRSGAPRHGWSNPTAWALEEAGRQIGKAVDGAADDAEEAALDAAENTLRLGAKAGRAAGLENAADSLDHFLDGTGTERTQTRDEARERPFIQEAEAKNQWRFFDSLLKNKVVKHGDGTVTEFNYREQILALEDGETAQILPQGTAPQSGAADYWVKDASTLEHILGGDPDEALAFGTNELTSEVRDGFTASRVGNTVTVTAVINHVWQDRYDFDGEMSPDPVMNRLRDEGRAAEYNSTATWTQKMTVEMEIVGGGLKLTGIDWHDMEDEVGP